MGVRVRGLPQSCSVLSDSSPTHNHALGFHIRLVSLYPCGFLFGTAHAACPPHPERIQNSMESLHQTGSSCLVPEGANRFLGILASRGREEDARPPAAKLAAPSASPTLRDPADRSWTVDYRKRQSKVPCEHSCQDDKATRRGPRRYRRGSNVGRPLGPVPPTGEFRPERLVAVPGTTGRFEHQQGAH